MSIETQLEELNQIKTNIFTSIGNKGVTVPENSGLKDAAGLIDTIEQGLETINNNYYLIDWISDTNSSSSDSFENITFDTDLNLEIQAKIRVENFSGNQAYIFSMNQAGGNNSGYIYLSSNTSFTATNRNNYSIQKNISSVADKIIDVSFKNDTVTIDSNTFNDIPFVEESVKRISLLSNCRSKIKLYSFKVIQNDVMYYDMIPVMQKSTGIVYFYDKINDFYYRNNSMFGGFD